MAKISALKQHELISRLLSDFIPVTACDGPPAACHKQQQRFMGCGSSAFRQLTNSFCRKMRRQFPFNNKNLQVRPPNTYLFVWFECVLLAGGIGLPLKVIHTLRQCDKLWGSLLGNKHERNGFILNKWQTHNKVRYINFLTSG